jgi:hypothetical protein
MDQYVLMDGRSEDDRTPRLSRRNLLALAGVACASCIRPAGAADGSLKFGLTPVFLTNDIDLLSKFRDYLSRQAGREVQLVQRRTYEEITTLLPSRAAPKARVCGCASPEGPPAKKSSSATSASSAKALRRSNSSGGVQAQYHIHRDPGSYQSTGGTCYEGEFQFIKDSNGLITHRLFVPTTSVGP